MEIDIYQQCPCHTGKKIKFCCGSDIVSDLNQIVARCNSNQSLSAIDQIDRVISKHGEKDCLLTLKTHILFNLGEIEKAAEVNKTFIEKNPNHPVGHQHESMVALGSGDVSRAIEKLQDAMDLVKGEEIPLPMANTFKMLGTVLLSAGHVISARTHLQFTAAIRGEMDEEVARLLHESYRMPGLPLSLKADFKLDHVPEDVEWSSKFAIVLKTLGRGQFRLALKMLEKMNEHFPNQYEVVRGIAVTHSILAHEEKISDAWKDLARVPEIEHWKAVEAEALSQIFLPADPSGTLDIAAQTFELSDFDSVIETSLSNPRFVASESPQEDPFEEGPPPRNSFFVLDRNQIEAAEDLAANQIPLVAGEFLVYGKQTDRNARLVFVATKNENFNATSEFLKDLFRSSIADESQPQEQIVSTTSVAADCLAWNWHMPKGVPVDRHRAMLNEFRREIIVEKWPNLKFSVLENKSPLDVAGNDEYQVAVEALVLNLEQSTAIQTVGHEDMAALKQRLSIQEPEELDASSMDDDALTPMRTRLVNPETFSDEQMIRVYADAVTVGNTPVLKKIVPQILARESLKDKVSHDILYLMLAQLAETDEEAVEQLQKARQEAKAAGRNVGLILVQEFEIRLTRGITDKLAQLLHTIQKNHMADADVEYQLVRVLSKFGLISPDGRTVSLPQPAPNTESAKPESSIWTPDSDLESGEELADQSSGGASKIWVPDSD